MWHDDFALLSNSDQERFKSLVNYLLNKTHILSDIYEPRDRIGKINGDYRFIVRYFEIFKGFLDLAGYDLLRDDERGIVYISSRYNNNNFKLDKFPTLFLLALRQIYDEEIEKNSSRNVVFIKVGDVVIKMLEQSLVLRKPTISQTVDTLRTLIKYNIVSRIEGNLESAECTIVVYPTIMKVVSNEKIAAIYQVMFKEEVNQESETFDFDHKEEA